MQRREFLQYLGIGLAGLAGGWPFRRSLGLGKETAGAPEMRLAFLADAHLPDGDPRRPEARALARAVAELRQLQPPALAVLFAGDLAQGGDPAALALGKEILAGLPCPLLMVRGEEDGPGDPAGAGFWQRLFGEPWFSQAFYPPPQPSYPPGEMGKWLTFSGGPNNFSLVAETGSRKAKTLQVLGVHTAWNASPGAGRFQVGTSGLRRLSWELERLDPDNPLLILSHAPLDPIYLPWQQWTVDGPEVLARLRRFRQVLCLHGHTHNSVAGAQGSGASKNNDFGEIFLTANGKPKTENRLWSISLPATSWPGPEACQGTPAFLRPGLGPAGCGWLLLGAEAGLFQVQPRIWQA